jgi:hypothetical protein
LRVQAEQPTRVDLYAGPAVEPPALPPARPTGAPIGSCSIAATGRAWATQSCGLAHTTGVHTLYLVVAGAANLNWTQFHEVAAR